ncbi:MAG: DUF308 domain-containing protein [Lachnospiraceae bacterium]|nr:DUF308 domain-containing protein [Lachnospiraceae bacterium]
MFEALKRIRLHVTLSAVLTLALGVVLIARPVSAVLVIAQAVGVLVIIIGVLMLVGGIASGGRSYGGIIAGAIVALIGGWVLMNPDKAATIIPMVIGVLLIAHGIQDFSLAFSMKQARGSRWVFIICFAILNIIFGVICVTSGLGVVSVGMMFVGAMLVYDGLSSMVVVHRVNAAERRFIDAEARILDDEDDLF